MRAGEFVDEGNIIRAHPLNPEQMLGGPVAGHGGVRNLSNDELLRFGGPKGTDPISGSRVYLPGDDVRLPASGIELKGGHHRTAEIGRRVREGKLDPNTLVEMRVRE